MDKFLVTPKTRKKLLASLAVILLVTLHISFLRSLMMNHAADNVLVIPLVPIIRSNLTTVLLRFLLAIAQCLMLNEVRRQLAKLGRKAQWACVLLMAALLINAGATIVHYLAWNVLTVDNPWPVVYPFYWMAALGMLIKQVVSIWLAVEFILHFAGWLQLTGWLLLGCTLVQVLLSLGVGFELYGKLGYLLPGLCVLLPYVALYAAFTSRKGERVEIV